MSYTYICIRSEMSMISAIMLSSLGSMMKILFISIAGVLSAKYPSSDPILPASALKGLARLNNLTLLPCLIVFSLGATLTPALLVKIGILILFCAMNYSLSYVVALTVGRTLHEKDNEELFVSVLVAICNPNAVALPILLMQGICQNPIVNQDFNYNEGACADLATSMIFVYITGWFIMFWGFSFPLLQKRKETQIRDEDGKESLANLSNSYFSQGSKMIPVLKQIFLSPSMIAIYIGLLIGIVTPLQRLIFTKQPPGLPFGDSISVIGNPVVCLNCIIMAASLAHCDYSPIIQLFKDCMNKLKEHNSSNQKALVPVGEEVLSPLGIIQIESNAIEVRNSLVADEKGEKQIFHEQNNSNWHEMVLVGEEVSNPLGFSQVESNVIEVRNSSLEEKGKEIKYGKAVVEEKAPLPQARSVVALIVCRLLICPLLSLLLVKFCLAIEVLNPKTDRLMSIFIVVQGSTPPAQVLITTLNQLGFGKIASSLSYMFLFVYLLSILTVTIWVTISIFMVYE